MLTKIYINNYKTLINLEMQLQNMQLLLGHNGAGKSTIIDVIDKIKKFITNGERIADLFFLKDYPYWIKTNDGAYQQHFELSLEGNSGRYFYRLVIDHNPTTNKAGIHEEKLLFNEFPLFDFSAESGLARLYGDDNMPGPEVAFDWSRSGVGALPEGPDNKKLVYFRNYLNKLIILRYNAFLPISRSVMEEKSLSLDGSNFPSWYRYLSLAFQKDIFSLTNKLSELITGFESFSLDDAGEVKILKAIFIDGSKKRYKINFHELSEGQKALAVLYTITACLAADEYRLIIDEPENFLDLTEIQPWLDELWEVVEEYQRQAILISHHPKLINFLAKDCGYWIFRDNITGPTRYHKIAVDENSGLSTAELVSRGWLLGEIYNG